MVSIVKKFPRHKISSTNMEKFFNFVKALQMWKSSLNIEKLLKPEKLFNHRNIPHNHRNILQTRKMSSESNESFTLLCWINSVFRINVRRRESGQK